MRSRFLTGSALASAAVLVLAVNILAANGTGALRFDLTENSVYSLSQGTRNILAALDEPVSLRLFVSRRLAARLPGIHSYAQRIIGLLEEYQRVAGANLSLSIIDPDPFSEEEDRAVSYGLQGIPLEDRESIFYLGLVAAGPTDEEAVLPFLSPEREALVEHDLTNLIYQVANPGTKVVGLMSSLPIDGTPNPLAAPGPTAGPPTIVMEQIRQLFEVRTLAPDINQVPDEVDVLMLVHPTGLNDAALYAIDQYIMGGGNAVVFLDPHAEAQSAGPGAGGRASEAGPLLASWGIELVPGKVAADLRLAEAVRVSRGGRALAVEYPVWMTLGPEQLSETDVVTARLGNVMLATPGHLRALKDAATTFEPLLRTTEAAAEIDAARLAFMADPQQLLRDYRPGGKPLTLAARITGNVKSAFPNGAPKAPADGNKRGGDGDGAKTPKGERPAHLSESKSPVNLLVVADTDLLQDRFWVRVQNVLGARIALPTAANGSFVINALDNLTGSNDLISVRNRGHYTRNFTALEGIRQQAELRFRQKEQELLNRLQQAERKLVELEQGKQGEDAMILSTAQEKEIANFREQRVRIRRELRDVRHALRKDIAAVESWSKFANIGLMPLLVALGGLVIGWRRARRRRVAVRGD